MRRLLDHVLRRPRVDQLTPTDRLPPAALAAPAQPPPRDDGREGVAAGLSAQLFKNGRCCPACGSVRTATLAVLRPEPPGHWTAQRRCRACGHNWDEVI